MLVICHSCREVVSWVSSMSNSAKRDRRANEELEMTREDAAVKVIQASVIPGLIAKMLQEVTRITDEVRHPFLSHDI